MDYREKVRKALRTRCVHLKTKRAYLGLPEADDRENPIDTATWWCERTCEPLGPDGEGAEPEGCEAPGRSCYEAPTSLEGRS